MSKYLVIIAALTLTGCQTMYYGTMEKFGVHKRDIMVDRVEDAHDEQTQAKEQFQTAMEKFSSVIKVDGSSLEQKFKELKTEYDRCQSNAKSVTKRIQSVEDVSEALFSEWKKELDQYSNIDFRRSSEKQLGETRSRYMQMIAAMRRAEKKMTPVLSAFHDQVLFLKHNLNARAIAAIQGEVVTLEGNVAQLISDMEKSINEANKFIATMNNKE